MNRDVYAWIAYFLALGPSFLLITAIHDLSIPAYWRLPIAFATAWAAVRVAVWAASYAEWDWNRIGGNKDQGGPG